MRKIFTITLFLLASVFAQDIKVVQEGSSSAPTPVSAPVTVGVSDNAVGPAKEPFTYVFLYPASLLLGLSSGGGIGTYAVTVEHMRNSNWSYVGEFTYRHIPIESDSGSYQDIKGDMYGLKAAGRYYFSGREGILFLEPGLAYVNIPDGFPGWDLDEELNEDSYSQSLVQSYTSLALGIGIRTGASSQSPWSFTLGYHYFVPLSTSMTGKKADNAFEQVGNLIMGWLGEKVMPYRSFDAYIGVGYRI